MMSVFSFRFSYYTKTLYHYIDFGSVSSLAQLATRRGQPLAAPEIKRPYNIYIQQGLQRTLSLRYRRAAPLRS